MGGVSALSWVELLAWKTALDVDISPWGMSVVRDISAVYADQITLSSGKSVGSPYRDDSHDLIDRREIDAGLRQLASKINEGRNK